MVLRERVGRAGGVLISCPEYARGITGSFKNAVGSLTFPDTPVARGDQILIFCQTPERQRTNNAVPSSIRYNTTASQPP
jgi:NAD(P)H-dependent FMN reductase